MINKLINQLSTEMVDFFKEYGIIVTAQYTPELPGIMAYSRNFLTRTLSNNQVPIDGSLYQDKLLYRVDTPKLASFAPQNNQLTIITGEDSINQGYTIEHTDNTISKIRNTTDDGNIKLRDVSLLEIPVEFSFITESSDTIFSITSLFYQQLVSLTALEIPLNIFNSSDSLDFKYFLNWDRESLEISYANFETTSTLNTVSFKLKISGPVFSEFYSESNVINKYEITVGRLNPNLPLS